MQSKNTRVKIAIVFLAIISVLFGLNYGGIINVVTLFKSSTKASNDSYVRIADPSTMDSYQDFLLNSTNGSRYAGRIWADKSVLAKNNGSGTLALDMDTDGINKNLYYNSDFLHVYSTLGSSLKEKSEEPIPVDVVFIIDLSGSMGTDVVDQLDHPKPDGIHQERIEHSRIYQTVKSVNNSIEYLMNKGEENRVSVVVYGAAAYTLMDLGHYEKENGQDYITVDDFTYYTETQYHSSGSSAYTLRAHAIKDGEVITRTVRNNYTNGMQQSKINSLDAIIGFSTNLQAGIYQGFNELYRNMQSTSDVTYTYRSGLTNEKVTVPRIPVAIVMSDGASNYALKDSTKNIMGDEWYNIKMPTVVNNYDSDFKLYRTETNQANSGGKETILEILLTASFMKSKVQNKYNELISNANIDLSKYSAKFNVITLSVDTPETSGSEWQVPRVYTTLDPKTYFKKELPDVDWKFKEDAINAYTLYEQWQASSDGIVSTFTDSDKKVINLKINKLPEGTDGVSNADIINNINYNDEFADLNSDEVSNFFDNIISNITETTFMPVGGDNEYGVGDSITYTDPIGKYMNVKENALTIDGEKYDMSLLLFGKLHNMRKVAVYDYTFNSTHRGPDHNSKDMSLGFTSGWYDKEGNYLEDDGSWDKGDTYYADVTQVQKYIPTLDETNNITPKQKKTIYTLYSYIDEDGNVDLQNPCYDNAEVTYKLNDIRVWTEYTGNYVDESGISPELGYDNALYVNIPTTALPLQMANVQIDRNGKVFSYNDNTSLKTQSTPLRLFYSVGIDDSIMTEDGLDIDLAKVNQEYIQANKKNDTIYFYANYYSATKYDGYVTDTQEERTRGDASVTFSPDKSNRYYTFQKALPLYEVATSDSKNDKGGYNEIPLEDENAYNVFKATHNNITDSQKLNPDSWYYIVVDYYMPGKDTIMRLAVPREGKEFGSGIAGGSVDAGAYLSWYSQSLDKYVNFVVGGDKPDDADDYVIATRPGGLRVGDLAQSLRQKSQNNTQTSRSYYLPTVSTSNDNIVIDDFLGNNGRLDVSDSLMMIAKEVKTTPFGEKTIDRSRDYQFEVKIDGHEGDYSAIKMYKNPYSNEWQLRLSTIDILTDNDGFLQDKDTKLYVYEDGGQQYYVYIGDNEIEGDTGGDDVFRVYSAPDNDNHIELTKSGMTTYVTDPNTIEGATALNKYKAVDDTHTLGSIDFWIDKVYLIPTNIVDEKTWDHSLSGYKTLTEFVVAHLDSMKKGVDELTTSYKTETSYLTTTLKFGYTAQNKPASKPTSWTDDEWDSQKEHIAKLVLKDNEGIMLSGLKSGVNYETIEEITTKDNKEGYYFEEIKLGEEDTATITDKTVKGRVNANYIDEVEYINRYYAPTSLAIKKTVSGSLGEKDKDWTFKITLTPPEGATILDSYNYRTENLEGVTTKPSGEINFTLGSDGKYQGETTLKHGQTIIIDGLPEGTTYEVSEDEANQDDYITNGTNTTGTLTSEYQEAIFDNAKYARYDINITKEIKGEDAEDKDWTFEVALTPKDGIPLSNSYVYTGDMNGQINLVKNSEGKYVGEVKIRSGKSITIKGIPEETSYVITEKEANQNDYITLIDNNIGTLNNDATEKVKFTNIRYSRHKLTIGKTVTGGAGDKNKEWTFEVTFTPDKDVIFDSSYDYKGGSTISGVAAPADGKINLTEKNGEYKGEITLKHGQKITIQNIPERTNYDVVEKDANKDEYTTKVTVNKSGVLTSDEEQVMFTNRKLTKHDLTISKTVSGGWASKERDWTFKVTLTPADEVYLDTSYNYEGSKEGEISLTDNNDGSYSGTVTLKHNETITIKDLPEGTHYKVEEVEANSEGYTTRVTGHSEGTFVADTKTVEVAFNNIKLSEHSLTVSKEVTGGDGDQDKVWNFIIKFTPQEGVTLLDSYSITSGNFVSEIAPSNDAYIKLQHNSDGTSSAHVTLKHGQSLTINNLPEGTHYKVEEVEANTDEYITIVDAPEGVLEDNAEETVKFINKKPSKHDLVISKTVDGGAGDKNKEWTFNITFIPDEHVSLLDHYLVDGLNPNLIALTRQSDGSYKGTIKLKSGDKATIKSMPEKTQYKIEEVEANTDDYITTIKGNIEGVLEGAAKEIIFTNTKLSLHNLVIRKSVKGNLGEKDKAWTFKIILVAPAIKPLNATYPYEKITFTEEESLTETGNVSLSKVDNHYEAEVSLKDSEQIIIKGLSERTKYKVEEIEANTDDYETTFEGEEGTISDKDLLVAYTNTKFSRHRLKIESSLKGNNVDSNKEWTVDVTITPDPDAHLKDSYVWTDDDGEEHLLELTPNEDGSYSGKLTLKGNSSGTIDDLPYGTTYEVKVEEENTDGYKTTIEQQSGTLTEEETIVPFVNERNIKIPNTIDNIAKYFIILVMTSLITILGLIYYKKERGTI